MTKAESPEWVVNAPVALFRTSVPDDMKLLEKGTNRLLVVVSGNSVKSGYADYMEWELCTSIWKTLWVVSSVAMTRPTYIHESAAALKRLEREQTHRQTIYCMRYLRPEIGDNLRDLRSIQRLCHVRTTELLLPCSLNTGNFPESLSVQTHQKETA
jgi:hypothetical protein